MYDRTVWQETTKYKAGTLPLNMYQRDEPIDERIQFKTASSDNLDTLDETSWVRLLQQTSM